MYNITLDSRLGGITLKAVVDNGQGIQQGDIAGSDQINSKQWQRIMSQIAAMQETSNGSDQNDNADSSAMAAASSDGSAAGITAADSKALTPLIADGSAPAKGVSISMTELTDSQYQPAVVDRINSTPAGETLRIETDTAACFDSEMLNAFAARGIDIEVVFTYNGQKMRVVIPRGYDVSELLDEKGYCGFLRLASILGATTV